MTLFPGGCLDELERRGFKVIALTPLGMEERKRLVTDYLGKFGKRLEPELENMISGSDLLKNPLLLCSLLNELRIFGLHEGLRDQSAMLLSAASPEDFFELILQRLELDFELERPHLVRDLMCAVHASKHGLSEPELMELLTLTRLDLSQIISSLGPHFIEANGLLGFSHSFLKEAVEHRYLSRPGDLKRAHRRFADYFEALPPNSVRVMEELPYQYFSSGQNRKLRDILVSPLAFPRMAEDDPYALCTLWNSLLGQYNPGAPYRRVLATILDGDTRLTYARAAGQFLALYACYADALYFDNCYLKDCTRRYGGDSPEAALAYGIIAEVQSSMSRYKQALSAALRSNAILDDYPKADAYAENLNVIANVYFHQGDYAKSLETNLYALALYREQYGENYPRTAACYQEIAWDYEATGDSKTAEEYLIHSLRIRRLLFGENHPETASCYTILSWVYDSLGTYTAAMDCAYKSLDICRSVYGMRHPETGMAFKLAGTAQYRIGRYEEALALYETFKDIALSTYGEYHSRSSQGYFQTGLARFRLSDYVGALAQINRSTNIDRHLMGDDAENDLAVNYNYAGACSMMLGKTDEALALLTRARTVSEAWERSYDLIESHYFLGHVYLRLDRTEEALTAFGKALSLNMASCGDDHPETGRYHYAIGQVPGAQEARRHLDEAERIFALTDTHHLMAEVDRLMP